MWKRSKDDDHDDISVVWKKWDSSSSGQASTGET